MECNHCGKMFDSMVDFRKHIKTHDGAKPYNCHICGRSFGFEAVLKKHLMFHNGQKPFQCLVCSAAYTSANDLRMHAKTHTGDKPYKCRYCNLSFLTIADGTRTNDVTRNRTEINATSVDPPSTTLTPLQHMRLTVPCTGFARVWNQTRITGMMTRCPKAQSVPTPHQHNPESTHPRKLILDYWARNTKDPAVPFQGLMIAVIKRQP